MLKKLLLTTSALLITCNTFADNVKCPPTSLIANAKFIKAKSLDVEVGKKTWGLLSSNFLFENQDWNVVFSAKMPKVKTAIEAIEHGQEVFQSVKLNEPTGYQLDDHTMCSYTAFSMSDTPYLVMAINPPSPGLDI